jgi:hypothetical protein
MIVPLPYHRMRDDEDLDEELSSKYGKEKGFSLRRAAFKLEGLRAQLIKRNKKTPSTVGDEAINAGPTGDPPHRDYEPRRLPSFAAMSSIGSNGGEDGVLSDSP